MGALQIRVLPYGEAVSCKPGQTLLAAILEHGRYLRYGCKNGGCSTCKVLLVDGEVDQRGSSMALSSSERAEGWALLCSASPLSDCTIDATTMELTEEEFLSGDQTSVFLAEVEGKEFLTADICRLRLRLIEPDSIKFTAGQFVNVEVPGSHEVRSFSMANPPSDRQHVELIVKLLPRGLFSGCLQDRLANGDQLRLYGPFGQLKIRLSHRPIVAIAGGSGMAPIVSMLSDLAEKRNTRPVTFFFGARRAKDLYFQDRIQALTSAMPALKTIFALSEEESPGREGEIGLVTEVLARQMPSLKGYDAYLCGPPGMIEAAVPLLLERGVRERNIYLDAFVPSGGQ